jgi:2-polyprenyl-3-methyl-5-hydroxy-6-metoxy-1,4-benzoquinol methylase
VDIGCGSGMYCRFFSSLGWEIVGLEGTPNITLLGIYDDILEVDLTKPIESKISKFDFTLCLEVGEHIPKKHEQQFIDNICYMAGKDLVLSWAIPGQYSASGHVNCQLNEYILEQFDERGFDYRASLTIILRESAEFSWFKDTVMCFRRRFQ